MKKSHMIITVFPAITMMIISVFCFSNLGGIDLKGIFVLSLVGFFPLLVFIQGVLSALSKVNILLSLGMSIVVVGVIMTVIADVQTGLYYGLMYLVCGVVGYGIVMLMAKTRLIRMG